MNRTVRDHNIEEKSRVEDNTEKQHKSRRKKLIRRIGLAMGLLAFGFIIRRLLRFRNELTGIWNPGLIMTVLWMTAVNSLLWIGNALCYKNLAAAVSEKKIPTARAVLIYCRANLLKYLPGNIFHLVGRNQLAEETEAGHAQVAFCTTLEMICTALSGIVITLLFAGPQAFLELKKNASLDIHWALIPGILLLIIILAGALWYLTKKHWKSRILPLIRSIHRTGNVWKWTLLTAVFKILKNVAGGWFFLVLLQELSVTLPGEKTVYMIGLYVFSWLVGFFVPGSPGGIGIREAMLAATFGQFAEEGILMLAVILNRLVSLLGELSAFALAELIWLFAGSRKPMKILQNIALDILIPLCARLKIFKVADIKITDLYRANCSAKTPQGEAVQGTGFNRYDVLVRMLFVGEYYGENSQGRHLYKKMQDSKNGDGYGEIALKRFAGLVQACEQDPDLARHPILVDKDLQLVDGAHRLAIVLHAGGEEIPAFLLPFRFKADFSLRWFKVHGFTEEELWILEDKEKIFYQKNTLSDC